MPKFLLLENVPNLVSKQHIKSFERWLKKLTKLGYSTFWGVINSHNVGMIQARKRVYALSILNYSTKPIIQQNLNETILNIFQNEFKPNWVQKDINQIIDFNNKNKDESLWAQIKDTPSRIRMINSSKIITTNFIKLPTVTTKQDRLPNVGSVEFVNKRKDKNEVKYTNYRFITPSESYKMMGFTSGDYDQAKKYMLKLVKKNKTDHFAREKLWKQAGNSIVVNVLEIIFFWLVKYGNK